MQTAGLGINIPIVFRIIGNYFPVDLPMSIPNLYAWFSASDMTNTSGTTVSLWADRSANHRDAAPYGSTAPILSTNALNGRPALAFRSGDGLAFSGSPLPTEWTLFTVMHATGADYPASPATGTFPSGFDNFRGYIGEVVIYDRILSSAESSSISSYLSSKWRL